MKRRTTVEDVRKVALAALATALDDGKQEAREKPGLTGIRAMATGALLYTGARAAISGRRFARDHFGSSGSDEARTDEADRDEDEYDADAEAEEDFDDE